MTDDLISRQAVADWLQKWNGYLDNDMIARMQYRVVDIPSAQPTIDVKPVQHGHWVRNDNGTYSCSECQSWIPNEQHYYARYCLHCGAKMDEEKENECRSNTGDV